MYIYIYQYWHDLRSFDLLNHNFKSPCNRDF